MTDSLTGILSCVWRASWQAAVLAVLIAFILRIVGSSAAPRWRFWLLGLVVLRLMLIWTPVSRFSLFNLIGVSGPMVNAEVVPSTDRGSLPESVAADWPRFDRTSTDRSIVLQTAGDMPGSPDVARAPNAASRIAPVQLTKTRDAGSWFVGDRRWLWSAMTVWIAGSAAFALRILWQCWLLRQSLSTCRTITDERILSMFEDLRRQIGVRRRPDLIATPAAVSPCVAGLWRMRIILPESLLTEGSRTEQRHVLAHELAHLVRHDVRANWILLAVRAVHWFNPAAWWTFRQMRWQCEAACDDLALSAVGDDERHAYASTMLELAAKLAPHPVAPGMIGLSSSTHAMRDRMHRLLTPQKPSMSTPVALMLLLILATVGLTDANSTAEQTSSAPKIAAGRAVLTNDSPAATPASVSNAVTNGTFVIRSQCVDTTDKSPLEGVRLMLFAVTGNTQVRRPLAETTSDAEGRFTFEGLATPRHEDWLNPLSYQVIARANDRPVMTQWVLGPPFDEQLQSSELRIPRDEMSLAGCVTDTQGRPVASAVVASNWIYGQPLPDDPLTTRTDADGRFNITGIPVMGGPMVYFHVRHPDYPLLSSSAPGSDADVTVVLTAGCILTGVVQDESSGEPVAGAGVTATNVSASPRRHSGAFEHYALTDAAGRYRLAVPEGTYNVTANSADLLSVALVDQEYIAGQATELPVFALKRGGLISGRVINTKTGEPISTNEQGQPIALGVLGPSHPPAANLMSPKQMAFVDANGRFQLRAAAGENFPYLTNFHGDRMIWDTLKQPPVIVKESETTAYDLPVTPKVSAEEKMQAGRTLVAALPADPDERIAQIIVELRKRNQTVDETEVWCQLLREAVALGPQAVLQLCAELDSTTENRMQRRLGFALRAIGDARAVPALIRAIPRALHPSSSDYGLIVEDAGLAKFMQEHDISPSTGGQYFDFGRPEREVFTALAKLTGQDYGDTRACSLSLSEDPRRAVLQRRILVMRAQQWESWWNANWRTLTDDPAYQAVNLATDEPPLSPVASLAPGFKVVGEVSEAVLSPPQQGGRHFYDLDTGYQPSWPDEIPKDEASIDEQQLQIWAAQAGVDLMCITHRAADGTETFVLRAFDMQLSEISARDASRLGPTVAAGELPNGRPVEKLLMHYDEKSQQLTPDANGVFLYTTRDGNRGVIEVTDRITRTQDLTGSLGPAPAGVGFHKGVRFDLQAIIPN